MAVEFGGYGTWTHDINVHILVDHFGPHRLEVSVLTARRGGGGAHNGISERRGLTNMMKYML